MNKVTINKLFAHGGFRSLLNRALECGVKITILPTTKSRIIKAEYEGQTIYLKGSKAPVIRRKGDLTTDKEVTKTILDDIGIRTPRGITARSFEDAWDRIKKCNMSFPLILKPTHGSLALGVTWNIRTKQDLREAILNFKRIAEKESFKNSTFLVEEMFISKEYRVLVLNGKVISCVQKIPASIIGDGKSSIQELIATFNKTRALGFKIRVDAVVKHTLEENALTLDSVLENKRCLRLRNNLNMSDGGRSIDVTTKMHPSFKDVCIRATNATGLSFSGVDMFADNISEPAKQGNYVVLELNSNPYFNMNEKPLVEGKGVDVAFLLLKNIFPKIKETNS